MSEEESPMLLDSFRILHLLWELKTLGELPRLELFIVTEILSKASLIEFLKDFSLAEVVVWGLAYDEYTSSKLASLASAPRTIALSLPFPEEVSENFEKMMMTSQAATIKFLARLMSLINGRAKQSVFVITGIHINNAPSPGPMIWKLLKLPYLSYSMKTIRCVAHAQVRASDGRILYSRYGFSSFHPYDRTVTSSQLKSELMSLKNYPANGSTMMTSALTNCIKLIPIPMGS